jgi:hypothetical protein
MVAVIIGLQWAFRKMTTPDRATAALQLAKGFCVDVVRHIGKGEFARCSAEQRQIVSAYIFGGICTFIPMWRLNRTQVSSIVTAVYEDCLGYSGDESVARSRAIFLAAEDPTFHLNGIIGRGADGFLAWQTNREAFVATDIREAIGRMQ